MQSDANQSPPYMRPDAAQSPPNEPPDRLVTVFEAAELLGISPEAVRARIKRGTLAKAKSPAGTVYVQLDSIERQSDGDRTHDRTTAQSRSRGDGTDDGTHIHPLMQAHLDSLKEQLAYLREQLNQEREANRENRRIIAGLVQRVPELEPVAESRESSEMATPEAEGVETPLAPERRSWWRRFFDL
jgi:DNA-binding transcriptional MerR regulator